MGQGSDNASFICPFICLCPFHSEPRSQDRRRRQQPLTHHPTSSSPAPSPTPVSSNTASLHMGSCLLPSSLGISARNSAQELKVPVPVLTPILHSYVWILEGNLEAKKFMEESSLTAYPLSTQARPRLGRGSPPTRRGMRGSSGPTSPIPRTRESSEPEPGPCSIPR
ncbi:hypothetical protein EI555_007083 [Monodon monoceros]|uniref:Uncharacterized protein n=1 Tax=Monodon monoceros TaxID=40151 RepID=A0A4U1FGY4_MONMO|nr:hypothetical protein EI555_007083 [Monodon monoceros]